MSDYPIGEIALFVFLKQLMNGGIVMKEVPFEKSLEFLFPKIAQEWHPTKNGDLTPADVTAGEERKVWWLLPYDDPETGKHFDFEWEARINNRTQGKGCPYLTGKAIWIGYNDLATTNPQLAAEWHPTKNGELTPNMVTKGSGIKVWWFLPYDDPETGKHYDFEWSTPVAARSNDRGCPFLSGKTVWKGFNDLETICKQKGTGFLLEEWDYEKNTITPQEVTYHSEKMIHWKCKKGHMWEKKLFHRTQAEKARKCPYCEGIIPIPGKNDLKTKFPEIAQEWDYEKNKKGPENYLPRSGKKVYWKCINGHSWSAVIASRTRDRKGCGCKQCSGKRPIVGVNDLITLYKEIADEWDYNLNKDRPEDHLPYSSFRAFWKCKQGHPSWKASIAKRTKRGDGCPYCSGRCPIVGENDLKTEHPELIKLWDEEKNKKTMSEYKSNSIENVFWKCEKGHEYRRKISDQTRSKLSCPYCSGKKPIIGVTDLATLNPDICKEWSERNKQRPSEYTVFSNKKVWWKCPVCLCEWKCSINNRVKGRRCAVCSDNWKKKYYLIPKK